MMSASTRQGTGKQRAHQPYAAVRRLKPPSHARRALFRPHGLAWPAALKKRNRGCCPHVVGPGRRALRPSARTREALRTGTVRQSTIEASSSQSKVGGIYFDGRSPSAASATAPDPHRVRVVPKSRSIASAACWASGPRAVIVSSDPWVAPSRRSPRIDFASALVEPKERLTAD